MFSVAIATTGNGANTLFWKDNWLHNNLIANLALHLFALIPKEGANKLYSDEGSKDEFTWIQDLPGVLSVAALTEYLNLWGLFSVVVLRLL